MEGLQLKIDFSYGLWKKPEVLNQYWTNLMNFSSRTQLKQICSCASALSNASSSFSSMKSCKLHCYCIHGENQGKVKNISQLIWLQTSMETSYEPLDQIYRDYLTFFCIKTLFQAPSSP